MSVLPRNAMAAYMRAYQCPRQTANVNATRLMSDPRVKAAIKAAEVDMAERFGMTSEDIVKELRAVVVADPRDLIEYRRGACRYCYGVGFLYHRTPAEYRRDLAEYLKAESLKKEGQARDTIGLKFDPQGGVGFNSTRDPHPDCPECFGLGVGYTHAKDSRKVPKAAARLYAGVKETKDGLEIRMRSPDKSLELMMRNLGMLADKEKDKATAEEQAAAVRELVKAAGATSNGPA